MCMLCKEELLKGLPWRRIKANGMELLATAESPEEQDHVLERLNSLYWNMEFYDIVPEEPEYPFE